MIDDGVKLVLEELREFRSEHREDVKALYERLAEQDKRIVTLEKWRAYLAGAWVIVAASLVVAWEGVKKWFESHYGG